ncbi:Receptor-type tyrosine-protein phosphatase F [Liparis tanakae]|uniref:Receptor-type tyrosine-protein phosphatase F n=1 Tax=Liparis tanakae TaxID=230148 RepID=A0A4Z2JEE0_9TELE|nr:Receptor-type tyrosine-protein phosphatase F [Liparis tanakae]
MQDVWAELNAFASTGCLSPCRRLPEQEASSTIRESSHCFLPLEDGRIDRLVTPALACGCTSVLNQVATSSARRAHASEKMCCRALQIENSEESDQGKYECVAMNSAGTRYSAPANLYDSSQESAGGCDAEHLFRSPMARLHPSGLMQGRGSFVPILG